MIDDINQPRSALANVVRWIAILPAAALASWFAYLFTAWAARFGLAYADIRPDNILVEIYDVTLVHGCMGAAFVFIGTSVAPQFRNAASFVLAAIVIAIAGLAAFPAFSTGNWWALVGAMSTAVGAGILVWLLQSGEVEPLF